MPKVYPSDRAYANEIRDYLHQQRVEVRQGEALIKGHEKEIAFHKEHICLLKKQLRHQRNRARCLRKEHNEWRREVGLPQLGLKGKGK